MDNSKVNSYKNVARRFHQTDMGFGDCRAPLGSVQWAKAWRVDTYAAANRLDTTPRLLESFIALGEKYRAWTLLKDKDGQPFKTFDAFCDAPNPYGLETPATKVRAALEQVRGGFVVVLRAEDMKILSKLAEHENLAHHEILHRAIRALAEQVGHR